MATTDRHIAYHEAGHFIAAYAQGKTSDNGCGKFGVSIVKNGDTLGEVGGEGPDDDETAWREACVGLYAGFEAELRFDAAAASAKGHASDDDEKAARFISWLDGDPNTLEMELREQAKALVAKHWREVTAIAEDLLVFRRLDPIEAEFVAAAADGDADAQLELHNYRMAWADDLARLPGRTAKEA
jgi:hypothetical protein